MPVATGDGGGRSIRCLDKNWPVCAADDVDFGSIDLCFFTAGAEVSRELVPRALEAGCRVVDNTSAFRMDPAVPLVVPEINGREVGPGTPLVSCPNCTTINLVMTLAPILAAVPLERVVVTSFQSVSGAGKRALAELDAQSRARLSDAEAPPPTVFPKPIAFNCVPIVGDVGRDGYTGEEQKIIEETRKILGAPDLAVVPTAVRVPVHVGHALSVNVELKAPLDVDGVRRLWSAAPGLAVDEAVPTPLDVAGRDEVVIGRIRRVPTRPSAISYWAVGDNLRKGAATNSVQIAELWRDA